MIASTMLGLICTFAQAPIPMPDDEPWVIDLKDGTRYYGFVSNESVWDSKSDPIFSVRLDEPWTPGGDRKQRLRLSTIKSHVPEGRISRENRYKDNGYILVEGATETLAVEVSENDFAQRSNDYVSKLVREETDTRAVGMPSVGSDTGVGKEAPGFMEQWKGHFIVTGIFAALGLLVARTLILR
jgi:hypothetical protein